MAHTRLLASGAVAALLIGIASTGLARSSDLRNAVVTTAEVVVRERSSPITSIGISAIDTLPSTRGIDQLLATLPTGRPLTPGRLPEGWIANQKGKQIRLTGPAAGEVNARLDLDGMFIDEYAGKDVTVQSGFGGRLDEPVKLKISRLPKVDATPDLEGILTLPPQATPGRPFLVGIADPYRRGTWDLITNDGASVPLMPIEELRDMTVITSGTPTALYGMRGSGGLLSLLSRPAPRPFITAFPDTGGLSRARFTDRWGERLVDAPISISPAAPEAGGRTLTGGSAFTFAGQAACVSGRFPTFTDPYGLVLDGTIPLQPWGASQTTVMLGIPEATAAGPHTISETGGSSRITIGVLAVEGSLDQDKLWKGESTTMRLRIVGTSQKVPLGVLNRTPGIITIDGGVQQTVTTAGGNDNAITRSVKGIQRGNFTIVYSVKSEGCGSPAGGR